MDAWVQELLRTGVAGAMLYWFAIRMEKQMKNVEVSQDRNARATALLAIALDVSGAITERGHDIINAIDDKRRKENSE